MNSVFSKSFQMSVFFAFRKFNLLAIDALTRRTRVAQDSRSTLFCVSRSKTVTFPRAMSHVAPHVTAPITCTPSLSSTLSSSLALHPLLSEPVRCADPRCNLSGALVELPSFTSTLDEYGTKFACTRTKLHGKQASTPDEFWHKTRVQSRNTKLQHWMKNRSSKARPPFADTR